MSWTDVAIMLLAAPAALLTVVELAYLPLALVAARTTHRPQLRRRAPSGFAGRGRRKRRHPLVSVIVPAYNEAVVLARCVESILAERYPRFEVVLVDDGSADETWEIMTSFRGRPRVRAFHQENAGKAEALNNGISHARGTILMFVDADGLFSGRTIEAMVAAFADPRVGAVCGNDAPVNLDRLLPKLLCLLTHITALVRRALALVNCLTIVSGNCGAVRADVLKITGTFVPGLLGEDLELTWRVRAAGYRVAFEPTAIVYAEVPSKVSSLWRQRVRWARGYLQTARIHQRLIGSLRHGVLGPYLALNVLAMVLTPLLQLAVAAIAPIGLILGTSIGPFRPGMEILALAYPAVCIVVACGLAASWRDLRFAGVLLAMPLYSITMCLALATALRREITRAPASWNKFARTGVVSRYRRTVRVNAADFDSPGSSTKTPEPGMPRS